MVRLNQSLQDHELLDQWTRGDTAAGGELFLRYYDDAFAYCKSFRLARSDIKDILQDTFLSMTVYFQDSKNTAPKNFKAFLITSLKNKILDRNKSLKRTRVNKEAYKPKDKDDSFLSRFEATDITSMLLSKLSDTEKTIFQMKLNGYSVNEIAIDFNLSKSQIKGRLEWIRKKINKVKTLIDNYEK